MQRTGADLFTVWPTQITVTWAERLTVPLIALVVLGYLPVWGVHHLPSAVFGAANGQCMAWKRSAYETVGGHAAVRGSINEDIAFARLVKRRGLHLRMADGAGMVACRMYRDWPSVRQGLAKSILPGYGGIAPLLLATAFHLLLFLLPPLLLLFALVPTSGLSHLAPHLALITLLGITIRAVTAAFTRQRPADALLMPVSAVLMTVIALQAILWRVRFGGVRWKGRVLSELDVADTGPERGAIQ
jgi:chlorobactene glucosyltransferase